MSPEKSPLLIKPETKDTNIPKNEISPSPELDLSSFSNDNRGYLSRMSEAGKAVVKKAYEGVARSSGVTRVVGRIKIAYSDFWEDYNQKKNISTKNEIKSVDLRGLEIEKAKAVFEELSARRQGKSGQLDHSLQREIEKADLENRKLDQKKKILVAEVKERGATIDKFKSNRERIVDELVQPYEEKIAGVNKKVGQLLESKSKLLDSINREQGDYDKQEQEFAETERDLLELEKALRGMGESRRKSHHHEVIQSGRKEIEEGRRKITEQKKLRSLQLATINKQVEKHQDESKKYFNKWDNLVKLRRRSESVSSEKVTANENFPAQEMERDAGNITKKEKARAFATTEKESSGDDATKKNIVKKLSTKEEIEAYKASLLKLSKMKTADGPARFFSEDHLLQIGQSLKKLIPMLEDLEVQKRIANNAKIEAEYDQAYSRVKTLEGETDALKKHIQEISDGASVAATQRKQTEESQQNLNPILDYLNDQKRIANTAKNENEYNQAYAKIKALELEIDQITKSASSVQENDTSQK